MADESPSSPEHRPRRTWSRVMILLRRVHLYSGLFLLPWVFLYGITGAMYNHQNLFPEVTTEYFDSTILEESPMEEFPSAADFAQRVVDSIQASANGSEVKLAPHHGAEFTNQMMFEVNTVDGRKVVHLHPVSRTSKVVSHPEKQEQLEPVLKEIRNIRLEQDPHELARNSVQSVLQEAGVESNQTPKPVGWTKLNFLAEVDGEPVRVTYVLKDGHVDLTRHTGEDGMSLRHFFLRLHTTHGQSPHWNGRMYWSLILDTMAVAMVCWGVTGLLMWWQIKRTRMLGTAVILLSMATALFLYLSTHDFYVHTKL